MTKTKSPRRFSGYGLSAVLPIVTTAAEAHPGHGATESFHLHGVTELVALLGLTVLLLATRHFVRYLCRLSA